MPPAQPEEMLRKSLGRRGGTQTNESLPNPERFTLVRDLRGRAGLAPEVFVIGDADEASNISHTMVSAWEAILRT